MGIGISNIGSDYFVSNQYGQKTSGIKYTDKASNEIQYKKTLNSDVFERSTDSNNSSSEVSILNADFYIDNGIIGASNWGQKNADGTYTIYRQGTKEGSEIEKIETITEAEAKERNYI